MLAALPSAYRKAIVQFAPVLLAAVVIVQDALAAGTPLNSAGMWWQVLVAGVGAALVYGPPNPWVKTFGSLVTAVAAAVAAALTDNAVTGTELVQITALVLAWAGVGAVPNAPSEAVRPVTGAESVR